MVEAGAVTQFWWKKLFPTTKVRRSPLSRLRVGRPKALRVLVKAVVSSPEFLHQHDLRSVGRLVPIKDDKVNHRCQDQSGGQDKNRRPLHSGGKVA